jgi:Glu-tRNA(Gln) amidotransferase subunit E-like FAD-binding protein
MKHNYKELGFKAGLEIHQQLPGRKLFSHTPSTIRKDNHDFNITRELRASAGESGDVDQAAAHEEAKEKQFTYQGYHDTDSLVEIDEEPPHSVAKQALETALIVAKLLNMDVVDAVQFMRKIVIDGSNTTGFQRTALVAKNGHIDVGGRRIGIESLCLEEEACQIQERTDTHDTYNLSRLGIPLLEIATAPDIKAPDECRAAAEEIGMLLRSTERVKRGLGTIRQDVNVSIAEGARTEIKGFQDHRNIPDVIANEVRRQKQIVDDEGTVEKTVRRAEDDNSTTYLRPMPGADRMYPETDIQTLTPNPDDVSLPRTIRERTQTYHDDYDMSNDLADKAVRYELNSPFSFKPLFQEYTSEHLSANNIVELYTEKREEHLPDDERFEEHAELLLTDLSAGNVSYDSVEDILQDIAENGTVDLAEYELMSDDELRTLIQEIIDEHPEAPRGALMGMIMDRSDGQADGSKAAQILNELN